MEKTHVPSRKEDAGDRRSRGIGAAIAKRLAADGAAVAITYTANEDGARDMMPTGEDGEALKQMVPLGRAGRPEEIAGAVAFLAGPDATFITGTTLNVDGGILS